MNGIKNRRLVAQARQFRARFAQGGESLLSQTVPVGLLVQWAEQVCGRWRERIYGPIRTLALFIGQVLSADQSCQDAVARGLSERVANGQNPCSLNNGPYCAARKRLPLALLVRLAREVGARLLEAQPQAWLWRGRQLVLVDGSTVSMADTPANQAHFPQSGEQKPGLGFPLARLVAVISLSCGSVLAWASASSKGKQTSELSLLWRLAGQLNRSDVLIADRYYASYFMIARLLGLGVDVVTRQHQRRITDFRRGRRLGKGDHVVTWQRPKCPDWMSVEDYAAMPATLTIREARCGTWIVITTLTDARMVDKAELLRLYRLRWQVELDLRSIKSVMQMDILRCKSPEMVEKEIAAHLCAYNLVRSVMAQAAELGGVLPRLLSFKAALQALRAFEENLRHAPARRSNMITAILLGAIADVRLPARPDRVEPRAVKRRPKKASLLTRPREILKNQLIRDKQRQMAACLS